MKLPHRRQFLHLAAGAAALPAVSRIAWAQAYPSRPVRLIVRLRPRRRDRHRRAPDGSMAVGAARPAIRHREPAGCRQQYRHRGGRARARGRLHASPGRSDATRSTRRSTTSSISISSATSRRSRASSACPIVMVVNPSVPAKTVPEFIAYAKANPGKINMASAGIGSAQHVSGELFKMMTGVDMVHVPYRGGGTRAHRSARRAGAGHVRRHCRVDRVHQGRQAARAGGDHRDALGRAAGHPDRGRVRAGLRGERMGRHRRAEEHARRDRSTSSTSEINAGLADPKIKARLADLGGTVLPGSPADFGKLIADETEKWGKVIRAANIKPE